MPNILSVLQELDAKLPKPYGVAVRFNDDSLVALDKLTIRETESFVVLEVSGSSASNFKGLVVAKPALQLQLGAVYIPERIDPSELCSADEEQDEEDKSWGEEEGSWLNLDGAN